MKINRQQINSIGQDLDSGQVVYINPKTGEILPVIDPDSPYSDPEFYQDDLDKIEKEWDEYIVIDSMDSSTGFKVMEAFADEVDDELLQRDLRKILGRKSPFANFKTEIDESEYREKWFAFKAQKYDEYVKNQLEQEGIEVEL